MSEDERIIPVALEVTIRYTKGRTGLLVGFIREFPFITGQGESFEKLKDELVYDLGLYFNTFPEGNEKLKERGKIVGQESNIYNEKPLPLEIERPELGGGWQEKPIPVTVSSRS
jgi:predicted RNase H-like HicB family nuclease